MVVLANFTLKIYRPKDFCVSVLVNLAGRFW
jgi:hypothetical protein